MLDRIPAAEEAPMVDIAHSAPSFAQLLRRHRRELGLTQEALAERAGLSWRTISDLERGPACTSSIAHSRTALAVVLVKMQVILLGAL